MVTLPGSYLNEMQALLGTEYQAYLDSLEEERVFGLRVNTEKISVAEFLRISPFHLRPVPWTCDGFYYDKDDRPAKHPYYFAGLYYLQEPTAMLPAAILPVKRGDRVLDVAAAPGGKTTALGAKLGGTGLLFANDVSYSRCQALLKNVELFGIRNAVISAETPERLSRRFPGYFDKILIDAPCSGEGMFRKDASVVKSYLEHGRAFYTDLQKQILADTVKMLKPGGMMVYSTCTFSTKENEEAIEYLLSLDPALSLADPKIDFPGIRHGVSMNGEPENNYARCIRIFPHLVRGEGHFAALLKKADDDRGSSDEVREKSGLNAPPPHEIAAFQALPASAREFLGLTSIGLRNGRFELVNGRINLLTDDEPDIRGLRIVRNGLFLGEMKNTRFSPSQSLAMALSKGAFAHEIDLSADDGRALRYLKGETIDVSDFPAVPDGPALVLIDAHPVGFGKRNGPILKNGILPGWRYQ